MKVILIAFMLLLVTSLGGIASAAAESLPEQQVESSESYSGTLEKARAAMRTRAEHSARERELSKEGPIAEEKNPIVSMIQGLMLCLGLFALLIFVIKKTHRVARGGAEQRMQVIDRIPLSQKTFLHLISVDGKEFLVGSGPDQVSLLHLQEAKLLPQAPKSEAKRKEGVTIELQEAV